jgi:hypothetical protein
MHLLLNSSLLLQHLTGVWYCMFSDASRVCECMGGMGISSQIHPVKVRLVSG